MTAPFQGPVPWHEFVAWAPDDFGCSAEVGDFKLSISFHDDAFDSAPGPAWHYEVLYQGIRACHGFSIGATDDGRACQRTAVKMAAFHGMELPPEVAPRVEHLLADMHGVPDPARPGQRKKARRVAIDGHHPKMLRQSSEKD